MKYQTVIFDLDGTLLNTLEDLQASVNAALRAHRHPERSLEEVKSFIGNGVAILMRRSAPKGTPQAEVEEMLSVFRAHYLEHMYDHTAPYEGILELLDGLHAAGIRTAIVSNKLDEATKQMNLRYFSPHNEIAIGAPPDKKKPHPYSVYQAMELLHARPEQTVYVGDSDVDAETAKNAGIPCIGVAWGYRGREFLTRLGLETVADTPAELLSLLTCG